MKSFMIVTRYILLLLAVVQAKWFRKTKSTPSSLMDQLDGNITVSMDQAMSQMQGILFTKGDASTAHSQTLNHHLDAFKSKLVAQLRNDIKKTADGFLKSRKDSKKELSDEEKLQIADLLHTKWESTLEKESRVWKLVLSDWVHKASDAWHGMEHEVAEKLKKLQDFVGRHVPHRSS